MKTQLILATILAASAPLATPADAGPLSDVNRSIGERQRDSRPASSGGHVARPEAADDYCEPENEYRPVYALGAGTVIVNREGRRPSGTVIGPSPIALDALATYQNVTDSDGSLNADLRLEHGNAAIGFSSSSFFESDTLKFGGDDSARLTRWEFSLQGRALKFADDTVLWLGLGIGQLHGSGFENITGLSVHGELRQKLSRDVPGDLGFRGSARGIMYSDDINAAEFRAGLTASILHVGYRYLEFNAGPPLKGPEIGVSMRF